MGHGVKMLMHLDACGNLPFIFSKTNKQTYKGKIFMSV